jgi:hypothetical protein
MLRKPTLYSVVIWLTAVICSPVLFTLIAMIYNNGDGSGLSVVPFAWILGGLISLPSFVLLLIINHVLAKKQLSNTTYVGILLICCTGLAMLAFLIFSSRFNEISFRTIDPQYIMLIGCYLIFLYIPILSGLFTSSKKMIDTLDASELTADNGS